MEDSYGYFIQSMKRTYAVGIDYQTELDGNPTLAAYFATLKTYIDTADLLSLKLNSSTKVYTLKSDAIREKSAKELGIACAVADSYGSANNIPGLIGLSRFTYTELRMGSLSNQLSNSKSIIEILMNFATEIAKSGIDSSMLDNLKNDITMMETASAMPQSIIEQHKNDKKQLVDHLNICRKFFIAKPDKAMQLYQLKNLNFYLAYTSARKERHYHRKRKSAKADAETNSGILELLVVDKTSSEVLPNVKLVVTALNMVANTDEDGEIYADTLAPGSYQGKLFCDGYKDMDLEFVIEAGKTWIKQVLMGKL